jgi:putative ABC transport system ATP-binding protein
VGSQNRSSPRDDLGHRPRTEPVVEMTGVSKAYGAGLRAAKALDSVDLRVIRGEFVSLIGPSGSGKTTLLNLIAGLDAPDGGQITVEGRDISALSDGELSDLRLHRIGFIFQSFNLIPALSVAENIAWPLEFAGHSRGEVKRRVAEALARCDMAGRERRFPAELSGGEQQRVAIARAIATNPALLLADEPTGNLDSHTGRMILDLVRTLNEDEGVTVLMVTHNVFAATYGHRTLEVRDGRIVRDMRAGSPDAAEPRETEVSET